MLADETQIGPSASICVSSVAAPALLATNEPRCAAVPVATLTHKLVMGTAVGLPFLGCIAAAALLWRWGFMGWLYVGLLVGGWFFTGSGITVGFHRLLTHRTFDTYRAVEWVWLALGSLSGVG